MGYIRNRWVRHQVHRNDLEDVIFGIRAVFKWIFASDGEGVLQTLDGRLSEEWQRSGADLEGGGGKEESGEEFHGCEALEGEVRLR